MNKIIIGNFFWRIPFWEFLLHISWPAEISCADYWLLGYHTIVAWGLKGGVNEELCHGCWLRNGKLYSRLCIGFDPGSLWDSATDLKNESGHVGVFSHCHRRALQTSNQKPPSPEDQSRGSPRSQGDEAGNLGHSLARLRFQQGSQPTWCLPRQSSRLFPTLRWSFPALPHASAAACIATLPAGRRRDRSWKPFCPRKGFSAGKRIKKRHRHLLQPFLAWLGMVHLHCQLPLPKRLKVTILLLFVFVNQTKETSPLVGCVVAKRQATLKKPKATLSSLQYIFLLSIPTVSFWVVLARTANWRHCWAC